MRFHIGFSHRISLKTVLWILGTIFVGLCAFLGITEHEIVFADTIDIAPTQNYYYNSLQSDKITKPVDYQSWIFNNTGGYRLVNTSQGANSQDFTFEFTGTNLCSSSNGLVSSAKLRFLLYDTNNQQLNSFNIQAKYLSNNSTIYGQLENPSSGYFYINFNNFYPNRGFKMIFNSSDPSTIGLYSVYISKSWDITCGEASSDSSQDIIDNQNQNTADIINNQNQNAQSIIDSQNDINNSINDSNIDGALDTGNDFFDNFQIDDSRGFSSIVVAPIQFLRDLLTSSSSCSPLSIGFNPSDGVFSGQATWSIPCGSILWSRAPQPIILLWYTLIYGILGYRILVDMVRFINKTLYPEDTSEYIMDL